MADIQFVQFSDALRVAGTVELPGVEPRTLEIRGPDFRSAIEVFINEEKSPSFVVAAKGVILAQVPTTMENAVIRSISVLSSEFTATFQSKLRFRIGSDSKSTSGLRAMMQTFLKILFTTAGTDAFVQSVGGSALRILGRQTNLQQSGALASDFAIAIRRTESQMRSLQSRQPRLPDDEKLLSAELLHVKFDPQLAAILARVELVSQSGIRAITNLEL